MRQLTAVIFACLIMLCMLPAVGVWAIAHGLMIAIVDAGILIGTTAQHLINSIDKSLGRLPRSLD